MNQIPWNEIHWHDTVILSAHLFPDSAQVELHVDYPVNWDANEFKPKTIRLFDAYGYKEMEGPIVGPPTILEASSVPQDCGGHLLHLKTNAGYREVCYTSLSLEPRTSG